MHVLISKKLQICHRTVTMPLILVSFESIRKHCGPAAVCEASYSCITTGMC